MESTMVEVNGMAHVVLTVSEFEKSRAFYCELLPFLGLQKVYDGNNFVYHVGARTALGLQRCADEHVGERFNPNRVGMHHLCFRARSREDVEAIAKKLREMDAFIDRGPIEGDWAGIRLEVNHVPGKGLLAGEQPLSPSDDPNWDQNP
jgi:catechol 2,3-dioxygenase-like lactoylglutathione lyase family enzyme